MDLPEHYKEKFNPARRPKIGTPRTPRQEMLDKFLARLNYTREQDGFKPLTYSRLASLLQYVPDADLYPFFKQCEQARHFSKFFWYKLKA